MAGANLPAKKYSKTSPTVTRLSFELTGNTTQFIDLGLALSSINRKFYRQGVYYYVNSVEVYNNEAGILDFHTVPDTWVTKNAWNRGFKLWQKMNAMVDPVSGMGRPKYHDFKVYMTKLHRTRGSVKPSLYDVNATEAAMVADDWDYSKFVSADDDQDGNTGSGTTFADDFNVHMVGSHDGSSDNWDSIGLIASYRDSRPLPNAAGEPGPMPSISTDPLINVFDFSTEEQMNEIITNLDIMNDQTPYNADNYVGQVDAGMLHVARVGTESGINRIGRAAGFCAPFGLICIDPSGDGSPSSEISSDYRVVITVASGTYHGVYAERA